MKIEMNEESMFATIVAAICIMIVLWGRSDGCANMTESYQEHCGKACRGHMISFDERAERCICSNRADVDSGVSLDPHGDVE